MTVRKLVIHTKFNIDTVELETVEGQIVLTVNGQQSILDRASAHMLMLWLQEHLK